MHGVGGVRLRFLNLDVTKKLVATGWEGGKHSRIKSCRDLKQENLEVAGC